MKSIALELANYLSSENYTLDTMQDISSALGVNLGEIKTNDKGVLISKTDIGTVSARSKGADSIFSKIRNQQIYKLKADIPFLKEEAHQYVGDTQGVRINLNNIENPTTNNVEELSNQQVEKLVQNLAKEIKAGNIIVVELENYSGPNGIPYFSKEAVDTIRDAYEEFYQNAYQEALKGRGDYEIRKNEDGIEYLYNKKLNREFLPAMDAIVSKTKKNGYCATQISIVNRYGQNTELQIRGNYIVN